MQGKHGHLSREQKQLALRLHAKGWRLVDIAKEIGCSAPMVGIMARTGRHVDAKPFGWEPRQGNLTIDEREQILLGINRGDTFTAIAEQLGRAVSTVSREVKRGGGRCDYSAWHAHERARHQARRPKPFKLASGRLPEEVASRLEQLWSPQEIAARLRLEHPDSPEMHVSHETIYQALYFQARGGLKREVQTALRTGRTRRKPQARGVRRPRFIDEMIMISDRPAAVEDRAVPGHWEGDLIIGKNSGSAIGTLVERSTRYVMLLHLPDTHDAVTVRDQLVAAMHRLPQHLRGSLTWDQGSEMAAHASFTMATDMPVYFCDPASPWQRGSNENTNGLLRQYFPKGTDLSVHGHAELEYVAQELNARPRKTLDWATPAERLRDLLQEA